MKKNIKEYEEKSKKIKIIKEEVIIKIINKDKVTN
jgi:hypothetical protein